MPNSQDKNQKEEIMPSGVIAELENAFSGFVTAVTDEINSLKNNRELYAEF